MDLEVSVRQILRHHPRVEMIPVEVELGEAERSEIRHPEAVVVDDEVQRQREAGEGLEELHLRGIGRRLEHVDPVA